MAHIALTAYELENGGISRVAVYLANGFAGAGHRVTLLLCTSSGERDADLRAELNENAEYVALGDGKAPLRAFGQIAALRSYRRWLREEKPDIVLGTANNISWYSGMGLAFNRSVKSKLYIKTTNPIIREKDGWLVTAIRRLGYTRLFTGSEMTLTLSNAESEILEREFPKNRGKFGAVFNAYLTEDFLSQDSPDEISVEDLQLIAIGRLSPQKNMTRLIDAFALALGMDGDGDLQSAHLTIAGEGPEMQALKKLAKQRGIAERVSFAGFAHDIPAMLRAADIFVLSSNYEGLPAVVIEALGSNCPVVSTDCFPAARELLSGLPGCVVTDHSVQSLAEGILQAAQNALKDPALRARAMDYSIDSAVQSHLRAMGL